MTQTEKKTITLQTPLTEQSVLSLEIGDAVSLNGFVFTARDEMHKFLFEGGRVPFDLRGGVLYHCGPIVKKVGGEWKAVSAGPTTSMREELYEAKIIEKLGVRAIIGKGGMGEKTKKAMQRFGCVYLHAVGGAAVLLAEKIARVEGVFGLKQFGATEAMWKLRVKNFPAIVSMDARGESTHEKILEESRRKF